MKKIVIAFLTVLLFSCCSKEQSVFVTIKNPIDIHRTGETVELDWAYLKEFLNIITEENVRVITAQNVEIPFQVIHNEAKQPQKLIFQAEVGANSVTAYRIKIGESLALSPSKVYGRLVPERKDDFAWENNKIAFRIYGPALEATGEISNGIDVWVKSTEKLVIDSWYKKDDYHKDHGEGFDGYKVGRTLGAGAMAPYVDGKLVLGNNFVKSEIIENGPIRLKFKLTYAPYKVGNMDVTESRVFTLDANTYFNKVEEYYAGATEGFDVVAGIVLRKESGEFLKDTNNGIVGYVEPQNNDNRMNNGHTAVGIVFPHGAKSIIESEGHLLMFGNYIHTEPFVYYVGAGWSKSGFSSAEEWFDYVKNEKKKLSFPLEINVSQEMPSAIK